MLNTVKKTKNENFFNSNVPDIDVYEICQIFESAMLTNNSELKRNALNLICKICESIGFSFCQVADHIVQLIEKTNDIPDEWRWKTYCCLVEVLGIGSNLYKKFNSFSLLLIEQLNNNVNTISNNLSQLIISLLKTSLTMLNPQTIFNLQVAVCSKLLNYNLPLAIVKLLNAFLQFNHDEVPLPLYIAQSICNRYYKNKNLEFFKEIEQCRIVTNIYSRPKLPCLPARVLEENAVSSVQSFIEIDDSKSNISNENKSSNVIDRIEVDESTNHKNNDNLLNDDKLLNHNESIEISLDETLSDDNESVEFLSVEKLMKDFQPE